MDKLCMAAGKHLWFRMYVSVHLGAEKWKKTHFVAFSEEVFLTIGHVHSLVLNHVSADHHGCSEPEGFAENTVCRVKKRGWCQFELIQQCPWVKCRRVQTTGPKSEDENSNYIKVNQRKVRLHHRYFTTLLLSHYFPHVQWAFPLSRMGV